MHIVVGKSSGEVGEYSIDSCEFLISGQSMTKRITYLDSLKAILILLVILGHAVQFNTEEYETNPLFQFIYSFHMPLFCLSVVI